jgi:hypothetical protein
MWRDSIVIALKCIGLGYAAIRIPVALIYVFYFFFIFLSHGTVDIPYTRLYEEASLKIDFLVFFVFVFFCLGVPTLFFVQKLLPNIPEEK